MAHACSVPFENLDVLAGKGISVEPDDIYQKLVLNRRGGYCFEQNSLMLEMLQLLGFEARSAAGRIRLRVPKGELPNRTHVFVIVTLDREEYVVDCGMGGFSLTAPIRLVENIEQPTPHETRRIVVEGDQWFQQALTDEGWIDLFQTGLEEMPYVDRRLANWWTSTNPTSLFSTSLTIGLARPDGTRCGLLNDRFTHRRVPKNGQRGEVLKEILIEDRQQLRQVIETKFGLELDPFPELAKWPFSD